MVISRPNDGRFPTTNAERTTGAGDRIIAKQAASTGLPPVRATACCCYARRCRGTMPRLHRGINMGVRVARGLFRLWVICSVLWIAGVSAVTWQTLPADWSQFKPVAAAPKGDDRPDAPWMKDPVVAPKAPMQFDPDAFLASKDTVDAPKSETQFVPDDLSSLPQKRRAVLQFAGLLAVVPPLLCLALGIALRWVVVGFRP